MPLLFDCHLDLAWNALTWRRDLTLPLDLMNAADHGADEKFRGRATISFPEMRKAEIAVCLGTLMGRVPYGEESLHGSTLDFQTHQQVYAFARSHLGYYEALEQLGIARIIRSKLDLELHWSAWSQAASPLGIIISMEGADAIMDVDQTEHWFGLGLRCASLVHYGSSKYAVGTGEEGPLTQAGRNLLAAFDAVGMILDVTHLSDTSFFEATDIFRGPMLATHQACRSLVPGQRQFSDDQLRLVLQRGGIICIPCDAWMLFPNWVRGTTTREVVNINSLADHIDHVCQLAGNSRQVGIGSDLDGGYGTEQTPTGLDTIADLQKLNTILAARGYSDEAIRDILGTNAYHFFHDHLPG